jgi:hypothetical protein
MPDIDMALLIEVSAYAVYQATLVGNPAPVVQRMQDALLNPRLGDLVLEITTRGMDHTKGDRLGYLISGTDPYGARVIRTLDGREVKWDNAEFIRVFESFEGLRQAQEKEVAPDA